MKRMHLRSARRRAKLTQTELAKRLRIPQSRISKLELGQAPPPRVDENERIAAVLAKALKDRGVEADQLEILYGGPA